MVLCGRRLGPDVLAYAATTSTVGVNGYCGPDAFDTVCNEEHHGARLVVEHLVELGHERIAHIHAAPASGGPERRAAFIDAMVANGLAPILVEGDLTAEAGPRARGNSCPCVNRRPPSWPGTT